MTELQIMVLNYALRKVMLGRSHIQLEACLQNGQRHLSKAKQDSHLKSLLTYCISSQTQLC